MFKETNSKNNCSPCQIRPFSSYLWTLKLYLAVVELPE